MSPGQTETVSSRSWPRETTATATPLGRRDPDVSVARSGRVRPSRDARRSPAESGARLLAAICSGLLMWAAFPPHDLWWAAAVGSAGLTLVLRGTAWRAAFAFGLVAGVALFAPLLTWTSNVGTDAWLALSALQALFMGAMSVVVARVGTLRWWPLWTASAWVAQEAMRGRFPFGGFTWGRLGFAQTEGPLLQFAALGGGPLVTFTTVLLGALAVVALHRAVRRSWAISSGAIGAAALLLAGTLLVPAAPSAERTVTVAAVQGNAPQLGLDAFAQRRAVLDNHAQATRRLATDVEAGRRPRPDLVLWPENSSDLDPYTSEDASSVIDEAVKRIDVPTLIGAVVAAGPGKVRNSGIVWDPDTGPGETYVKQHPVPFAEYVPFRPMLTKLIGRFAMVPRDFVKGTATGLLQVGPARLGDVICFEVAYDPLVRTTVAAGAQLLVVQTNNATFGYSAETEQQLAMSRMRAVEHGRDVFVVATSGVSAVIGPDGTVRDRAEVFTAKTMVVPTGLRESTTLATRWGGLVEILLAGLILGPMARIWMLRTRAAGTRRGRESCASVANPSGQA